MASPTSAISAQWSVDESVDAVLRVAKGLIRAASADNVQALALLAASQFGATLAMSQETCTKVYSLSNRGHSSAVHFLQAQIGYSRHDSAATLCNTDAGLRFLSLAAALVNSMPPYQGATLLHGMMRDTASDLTMVPSVPELKHLLGALEHKLCRSSFANDVLGWSTWVQNSAAKEIAQSRNALLDPALGTAPTDAAIEALIDAFRRVGRIGQGKVVVISLTWSALSCVPWMIAFTKWSLGIPPSVAIQGGSVILREPGSGAAILVSNPRNVDAGDKSGSIRIEVLQEIGGPGELVAETFGQQHWSGMVTADRFGAWRIQAFQAKLSTRASNLSFDLAKRALMQALPSAIPMLSTCLLSREHPSQAVWTDAQCKLIEELQPSPLPAIYVVESTLREYTGSQETMHLDTLVSGMHISDLPLIRLVLEDLRFACPCTKCKEMPSSQEPLRAVRDGDCLHDFFFAELGMICADIFALSICRAVEPLQVLKKVPRADSTHRGFPVGMANGLLGRDTGTALEWKHLLSWALELVGHEASDRYVLMGEWLMSSARGQVLYPAICETFEISKEGFLLLQVVPGVLRYNNLVYKDARCLYGEDWLLDSTPMRSQYDPVCGPAATEGHVRWRVAAQDQYLAVEMVVHSGPLEARQHSNASEKNVDFFSCIEGLSRSLLLDRCGHSPDKLLDTPDRHCEYSIPYWYRGDGAKLVVSPVQGNNAFRLLSLGRLPAFQDSSHKQMHAVLRSEACLKCCLDLCRRMDYKVVVC